MMTGVFGGPQSLLCDPNPASPANSEAARLYGENRCESVPLYAALTPFPVTRNVHRCIICKM